MISMKTQAAELQELCGSGTGVKEPELEFCVLAHESSGAFLID